MKNGWFHMNDGTKSNEHKAKLKKRAKKGKDENPKKGKKQKKDTESDD